MKIYASNNNNNNTDPLLIHCKFLSQSDNFSESREFNNLFKKGVCDLDLFLKLQNGFKI